MSELTLTGTIIVINEVQVVSDKFSKREFVITDNSMYPQDVTFQLIQDKCGILDSYKVGDSITVSFNLKGRKWISPQGETKYFNTIEGWKIERAVGDAPAPVPVSKEDDDLLPF